MALPDYFKVEPGTAITWTSTGGNYALTFSGKTNGTAQAGAKGDLGAQWARRWAVMIESSVQAAPTAGKEIEVYWAPSTSAAAGTDNPAALNGIDEDVGTPDNKKGQCIFVGSLVLDAVTTQQRQYLELYPPTRYGMPLLVNKSGQTTNATGTNHKVVLTPVEEKVQDTV